jgi:hypothetical protein
MMLLVGSLTVTSSRAFTTTVDFALNNGFHVAAAAATKTTPLFATVNDKDDKAIESSCWFQK